VVVAGLHPQGKGLARGPRGFDQQLRLQLVREEGIGVALVNQMSSNRPFVAPAALSRATSWRAQALRSARR